MKKIILTLLTLFTLQGHGNGVGNGGDELRLLFEDGRADAAGTLPRLKRCSFPGFTNSEVVDWILRNQYQLANDVRNSKHVWITDDQVTCAWTQTSPDFDITLSFQACARVANKTEAGRLLVHESVHHLGYADETFADQVAYAVYGADLTKSCEPATNDPFDPLSCTGSQVRLEDVLSHTDANNFATSVGTYKIYSRYRHCQKIGGCTKWTVSGLMGPDETYDNATNWSKGMAYGPGPVKGRHLMGDIQLLNYSSYVAFGLKNPETLDRFKYSAQSWALDKGGFFDHAAKGPPNYVIPRFGQYFYSGFGTSYLQTMTQYQLGMGYVDFDNVTITRDCVRSVFRESSQSRNPDDYGELEVVLYGKMNL